MFWPLSNDCDEVFGSGGLVEGGVSDRNGESDDLFGESGGLVDGGVGDGSAAD